MPFRETHHIAGEAVRIAEDQVLNFENLLFASTQALSVNFVQDIALDELTLEQLSTLHPAFDADVVRFVKTCAANLS